jgi:hypothetical protein
MWKKDKSSGNNFRIFMTIILLSAIVFAVSCTEAQQKPEIKEKVVLEEIKEKISPKDVSKTTETKTDIISQNDELTAENIIQNRDLSEYIDGGHFTKGGLISKKNSCFDCDEKKVRDFIWKNWTEKKRAYIRITYNGIDAWSTSHIFIEPNENGEWRVAWRIARRHTIPEYNDLITDVPTIFTIERVDNKPEKGEWALVFKDKTGNIIETLPDFYIEK